MADQSTTVRLSKSTWARLNSREQKPGESLEDVIIRLLDETEHPLLDNIEDR